MRKRYEKIVYEDERGISFVVDAKKDIILETQEGTNGELFIKVQNIITGGSYSENYANPIIMNGYKHVCGEWHNGFVIERESDGSQFVWVPVGFLDSDATLDGVRFTEKFGRRNFRNNEFSDNKFHEVFTKELEMQKESVMKYGGFYISRYNISKNAKTGKPQSLKNAMPWVNVTFYQAQEIAASLETESEQITSHLPFGAEHDSVLAWFIKSEAKSFSEIAEDSTNWGNHWNPQNSPRKVVKTGSRKSWCVNGIYDFTGNVDEWTQENYGEERRVIRGANYVNDGDDIPAAYRYYFYPYYNYFFTGFRATLYVK